MRAIILTTAAVLAAGCLLNTEQLRAPAGHEAADPGGEGEGEGSDEQGGESEAPPDGEGEGEGEGEAPVEGEGEGEPPGGEGEGEPVVDGEGEGEGEGEELIPCGRLADELGAANRWVTPGEPREDANGSLECPFGSVAQALASLPEQGDAVLHLLDGHHPGGITLNRPGLTLRAAEASDSTLRGAGASGRVLSVASEGVSVDGLTLTGGAVGVFLEGVAGATLSDLIIRDLAGVAGGDGVGIWAAGADDLTIDSVLVERVSGGRGITFDDAGVTGGNGGSAIGLRLEGGATRLREVSVRELSPGAPGDGGGDAPGGLAGGKIAVWSDDLRSLDVDETLFYGEGDVSEPLPLVIGRLPEGGGDPVGCRDVEGLELSLSFTAFAPSPGRIIVMDCPGVTVADNSLRNTLGPPGAEAGEGGTGGAAPSVVGIRVDGCGGAIVRGNSVTFPRPGDGAPGAAGGLGGRGGGVDAIVLSNSPGAQLDDNEVNNLFGGANGPAGVGGPGSQPAGRVSALRVVRSNGVRINGLDIGVLFGTDAAVGIDLEASGINAEHVLIYEVIGLRIADGIAVDSQSNASVRLATLNEISSPANRGSSVGARVGGQFDVRWAILHDSPRVYAELGGTGVLQDSLIAEPADGHPEVQNVETVGEILRDVPSFIRPRDGDYRLNVGSPGVDEGPADPAECAEEPEGNDCILDWGRHGNTADATPSE